MRTKDLCVKLWVSGLLIIPMALQAQTRVCIINECKYPNDPSRFLPLQVVYVDHDFPSDVTRTNFHLETYFFETSKNSKHKTGIKNRDASFMIAFETACRLTEKDYHTTVPTYSELKTLREGFHTYDYDYSAKSRKNKFRLYLADRYSADILLVLLDSPFNLSYRRSETGNGRNKTVDVAMDMSCTNLWGIFDVKTGQIVKKFTTTGRGGWQWEKITSEARNLNSSINTWQSGRDYFVFGSWSLLPYIKDVATDATSSIEDNL